jgi:hypothetical protein
VPGRTRQTSERDERLDDQYDRVSAIDHTLGATDTKLGAIGSTLSATDTRIGVAEAALVAVDVTTQLGSLEETVLTLAEVLLRPNTPQIPAPREASRDGSRDNSGDSSRI